MNNKLTIVKHGWIFKRGEFIKNWRPRYFVLTSDGTLCGYKDKPNKYSSRDLTLEELPEPLNNFSILDSQIMKVEKPKPHSFIIRCFQMTTLVERLFHLADAQERDSWIEAITKISQENKDEKKKRAGLDKTTAKGISTDGKLEDYQMIKVIGRGTFGKVVMAKEKKTGQIVAIKLIKKEVIVEKDELEHTLTENKVLQYSNHPFLISLLCSFQTKDRLCFVMEFINGGELFFHLSKEKIFSEVRSRFYAAEIVLALKYLHDLKIVYRDLKLENLLLDKEGHIKIADFGLCKQEVGFGDKMKTFCGTPEYLAPEVIEDNDYGRAVDWWGLGIVLYEMLCGRLPFFNRDHEVLFELILTKEVTFTNNISEQGKLIISEFLNKNPRLRLGGSTKDALDVMAHVFFEKIDWELLYDKKMPAPFVPSVQNDSDTKYFDEEFTNEPMNLTPPEKIVEVDIDLDKI